MRAIPVVFILAIFSSLGLAQSAIQSSSDLTTEKELIGIAQQLLDAVASGDKAVWEKYVAEDLIFTDENWRILTKKQLIDSLAPLPKGYSGSIRIANVQSRINGDAAVLSYRALEEEHVFGQRISPTLSCLSPTRRTQTHCRQSDVLQINNRRIRIDSGH